MIDIFVKGEVVNHLQTLQHAGTIKDCLHMSVGMEYLTAFYPKCKKEFARRIASDNVLLDDTAYDAPSSYYWPECPYECPFYSQSENFVLTLSGEKSSKISEKDDLLPVLPKRAFGKSLEEAAKVASSKSEPLSLIIIDIDHFKQVNDTHGHPVGDEVLIAVSNCMNAVIRRKGKAFRVGGEEIAVLLPNFSGSEATVLAERIRIETEGSRMGTKSLAVTVSCGVASMPEHTTEHKQLVELADAALYTAKRIGRNCVFLSGEVLEQRPDARAIEKRIPPPGSLSDIEVEMIRKTFFTKGRAQCPKDGAVLDIERIDELGMKTPGLFVMCPLCGVRLDIPGICE